MKYTIGLDIGATQLRGAIISEAAEVLFPTSTKTIRGNPEALLDQVIDLVSTLLGKNYPIEGIGIGIPGPVKPGTGFVYVLQNIGISDFDIKTPLKERFKLPVFVDNDANVAAYGEAMAGAGKGYQVVQYITLSTGIGGGLVIDGKIYTGQHGFAQEIGNMIIDSGQPRPNPSMNEGSFESWCSGSSLVRMARESGFQASNAGDVFSNHECAPIVDVWLNHLGMAIANLININEPDIIILGGGLMKSSTQFFHRILPEVLKHTLSGLQKYLLIKSALLGQNSGLVGAGIIAFRKQ
ncbi:MAG: ROK family protein [Bacilli bacterium]|jgi:glucokinase